MKFSISGKLAGVAIGIFIGLVCFFVLPTNSTVSSYIPVIAGGSISGYISKTDGVLCGMLIGLSQAILVMWILGSMLPILGPAAASKSLPGIAVTFILVVTLGAASGAFGQWLRNR